MFLPNNIKILEPYILNLAIPNDTLYRKNNIEKLKKLSYLNKEFRRYVHDRIGEFYTFFSLYYSYSKRKNCKIDLILMENAVRYNNINVFKYIDKYYSKYRMPIFYMMYFTISCEINSVHMALYFWHRCAKQISLMDENKMMIEGLYEACKYGSIDIIENIIDRANCLMVSCFINECILYACKYNQLKLLKYLLENHTPKIITDMEPLEHTIKNNNFEMFKLLHEKCCIRSYDSFYDLVKIDNCKFVKYLYHKLYKPTIQQKIKYIKSKITFYTK